jgi:hypothetical protein
LVISRFFFLKFKSAIDDSKDKHSMQHRDQAIY